MIEPQLSFSIDDLIASEEIYQFLRIKTIGYELPINELNNIKGISQELFSRITLTENDKVKTNKIKQLLQKYRYNHHFISIEPKTAGLAAIAARDGRVDAIRISPTSTLKIFNTRYGRRLEESNKLVEVDLSFMFEKNIAKRLRPVIRVLEAFAKCDLQYIMITQPSRPMDLRSYKGIQSIARILGLSNKQTSPISLIERLKTNKKKLDGRIPFPGVEVI